MSDTSTSGVRVIRNTAINSASGVVNALLALVLTPFFLDQLGTEEYGVWLVALIFTLTQGFGLADLGLRQTGVRFIAGARGRGEFDRINEAVSSLLALFVVLGAVIGTTLAVFALPLADAFNVDADFRDAAQLTLVLVAIQLPIDMIASAFQAVIEGYERYGLVRIALVGTRALWAIGSIVVVLLGAGVVAVAVVSVAAALVGLVFSVAASRRCYRQLRPAPRHVTKPMIRELGTFGASFTVLRVASVVYNQMDKVVIASAIGVAAVAEYDVPYKVHAIAALVLSLPASALMPASALLRAQGDSEKLRELYLRGTRLAVGLGAPITLAALVHAEPIVVAWVGEDFRHLAGPTRVFLIYPLMVAFHNVASSMLLGIGRMKALLFLGIAPTVLNLVLSIILVSEYGLEGVIWATQIGFASIWIPYLVISFRTFGVRLVDWWEGVLRPNLLSPAVQVAAGLVSISLLPSSPTLPTVAAALVVNAGVGAVLFFMVGLPATERAKLRSSLVR